ncbi:MAG: hypothetical protein OXN80_02375 [bacterium]|nr:hypothetical protein [bacterium]
MQRPEVSPALHVLTWSLALVGLSLGFLGLTTPSPVGSRAFGMLAALVAVALAARGARESPRVATLIVAITAAVLNLVALLLVAFATTITP